MPSANSGEGAYFDLNITNTTSLLLSFRNQPNSEVPIPSGSRPDAVDLKAHMHQNPAHLSFRHSPKLDVPAASISLLARVDDEEYILLPNSSGLVSISSGSLELNAHHQIRIIFPMVDDHGRGVAQVEGLWISKFGKLIRVEDSSFDASFEDEIILNADNGKIGQKYRGGRNTVPETAERQSVPEFTEDMDAGLFNLVENRKRVLEIVTDNPGFLVGRNKGQRSGGSDGLLAGVMGWEYLLGEMFSIDHVAISVDGMCLMQHCIGGSGEPAGIGDVFFRRYARFQ